MAIPVLTGKGTEEEDAEARILQRLGTSVRLFKKAVVKKLLESHGLLCNPICSFTRSAA